MANTPVPLAQFSAAIFDMDGTMVNNMPYHKEAWREFFKRHNLSFSDEEFRQKISGKKNDQIFQDVFGKSLTPEEIATYTEEKEQLYRDLYAPHLQEIHGLKNFVSQLQEKNMKLGIATTAPQKNRDFVLEKLQLTGSFSVIVGDEGVSKGKPDPEVYLVAAQKLGVEPQKCLAFEDSPPGVESAKRAGMTVVAILTTHSKEELAKADYFVGDFSDIELV